jgi:AraC-like DNA-binding protein
VAGYYKYLSKRDFNAPFNLIVENGGFFKALPGIDYPDAKHPEHHYFTFSNGRRLNEYQLLYITEGEGIFESVGAGKKRISAGDMFLLFPGEWHRYRPDKHTGWVEYWVGFSRPTDHHQSSDLVITKHNPIVRMGFNENLVLLYQQIIDILKADKPGDEYLASGLASHLLSFMMSASSRQKIGYVDNTNQMMNKAKMIIVESMYEDISPESISNQLNMSYSLFRSTFKKYTGFSPKEYQIELRLKKARQLLQYSSLSVKEVGFNIGFNSPYHFSKLFKKRMGVSPLEYREMLKV